MSYFPLTLAEIRNKVSLTVSETEVRPPPSASQLSARGEMRCDSASLFRFQVAPFTSVRYYFQPFTCGIMS